MFSLYCRSAFKVTEKLKKLFDFIKTLDSDAAAAELLWRTRHKKVIRIQIPPEAAPENRNNYQVVLKSYEEKRFFRYLFRPSLAFREWYGYQAVSGCGIPTAQVVAAEEIRRGLRLVKSVFITEYINCTGDGDDFRLDGCRVHDKVMALEFTVKNLKLLAKLHRAKLVHGGLTPRNELYIIKPEAQRRSGDQLDVIWIDLATCRKAPFFQRSRLQKKDVDFFLSLMELPPDMEAGARKVYLEELKKNG